MKKQYTKKELQSLSTIEQAWDGDELKIDNGELRVWLTHSENRAYNGDYTIETMDRGSWKQERGYFA